MASNTEIPNYLDEQLAQWQNPILLKDGVGKSKPTIYTIPPNLTFGLTPVPDAEGAKEIVNYWQPHMPSVAEKDQSVDYLQWNRYMASCKKMKHINLDKLRGLLSEKSIGVGGAESAAARGAGEDKKRSASSAPGPSSHQDERANTVSDIDLEHDDYARRINKLNKLRTDKRKLLGIQQNEKREIFHKVVKQDNSWKSPLELHQVGSSSRAKSESSTVNNQVLPPEKNPASPQFVHGRRKDERPPTPMDMIIGMEYARQGALQSKEKFSEYQYLKRQALAVKHSGPTKASLGHAMGAKAIRDAREPIDDRAKWCLSKFKRVKGTLSNYIRQGPMPTKSESSAPKEYM